MMVAVKVCQGRTRRCLPLLIDNLKANIYLVPVFMIWPYFQSSLSLITGFPNWCMATGTSQTHTTSSWYCATDMVISVRTYSNVRPSISPSLKTYSF